MTTTPPNFPPLTERIEKLEQQNRKLKQWGTAALILAAAALLMGQASPKKTVEANEFILKDARGRVRGKLFTDMVDTPTLVLFDEHGKAQVSLTDAGGLEIRNPSGKAALGVGGHGPILQFYDEFNKVRLELDALEIQEGLAFYDKNGKERASYRFFDTPSLPLDGPVILLSNANGKVVWKAP